MHSVSDTLKSRQLVSTDKNYNSISTDTTGINRKVFDNDHLYEQLSDLVNDTFRPWYMKMFYKLGKDRVLQLASIARADGKDSARYFSYLIRKG